MMSRDTLLHAIARQAKPLRQLQLLYVILHAADPALALNGPQLLQKGPEIHVRPLSRRLATVHHRRHP